MPRARAFSTAIGERASDGPEKVVVHCTSGGASAVMRATRSAGDSPGRGRTPKRASQRSAITFDLAPPESTPRLKRTPVRPPIAIDSSASANAKARDAQRTPPWTALSASARACEPCPATPGNTPSAEPIPRCATTACRRVGSPTTTSS